MKKSEKYRKITLKDSKLMWVSISNPEEKEMDMLRKNFKFHHLDLEDCLSEAQRPKIDDYDNYLFIVVHVPVKNRKTGQIRNDELNIFIGQDFVITLHDDNPILRKLFDKCQDNKKIKEEYLGKGSGYLLYRIIDDLFESGEPILDDLTKQLNELEIEVFHKEHSQDRLKDILMLKKDIINFRRIIMPERAIVAQLEHKNKKFLPTNLDVYFDDIVDKIEKMWNTLENLQELVASLQETNESIISHNTNNVIKILTVFSVVMLPLTFITGFYGMNITRLPFAQSTLSVEIVTGIIITVAVSMIGYFKYKRWI